MKKSLHVLIIIFAFSQLNPMDRHENIFSLQDIKVFIKKNPVVSFIAAIGIPSFLFFCYKKCIKPYIFPLIAQQHNTKKLLWVKASRGETFEIKPADLAQYPLLDYYVTRFGYANSKEFPLAIDNKEGLKLLSQKVFLQQISENVTKDVSVNIARFLQRLLPDKGFLLTTMMLHNGDPMDTEYQDKHFFTHKEIYWKKISWKEQVFYDQNDRHLLTLKYKPTQPINNGLLFVPAYNGQSILTHGYRPNGYVKIDNLITRESIIIEGVFKNFAISPDGRWVGVRSINTNTIQIYSASDIKKPVAMIQHNNLRDFVFGPDGLKLISWDCDGERKVILWDLQNINNIKSKELCSMIQFKHVVWNPDNKHICLITAQRSYEYDKSKFNDIANIMPMNIDNISTTAEMFGPFRTAFIFPDQSDIILGENFQGRYSCTLLHKSGKQLVIPQDFKVCSINGDYIAFYTQRGTCIFDHQMNPVFKVDCSILSQLRLTPCTENIMIGSRFEGEKLKDCSWSLPDERTKKSFKEISKAMTVPQFLLLQEICLQQRKPREVLILPEKEHQEIFKTFDVSHQSFLKEKLYLELPQAS